MVSRRNRVEGGGCSYGRVMEALSQGLPAATRAEEAGTAFGIKTADGNDMLKLSQGGILESNSVRFADGANSKTIFHKPFLGLESQHFVSPLRALTGNRASFEWILQGSEADALVGTDL